MHPRAGADVPACSIRRHGGSLLLGGGRLAVTDGTGFLAETEHQVGAHLQSRPALPEADHSKSRDRGPDVRGRDHLCAAG